MTRSGGSGVDAVDDRPLLELAASWAWVPWLAGATLILRLVAVVGLRLYVYVDSGEYDTLDFSGRWRRPWATPALYRLIPGDDHRLVVAQAVVGAICWSVLAVSASAWFRTGAVRIGVAVALVALGTTTSITNWDTAKLSESLALSLTALLVAAWLNLVRRPVPATAALVVLATFPWLFVRQSLMPAAWMIAVAAVAAALVAWRRGGPVQVLGAIAAGLIVLTGVASFSYGRNQEVVRENLTVIVANRVATDPGRLAWFRDHGMPTPASGDVGYPALKADRAFTRWVAHEGRGVYLRYLVTHPWYSLTEPLDDLVGVRRSYGDEPAAQVTMLSPGDAYGASRPVEPELVEQVLFQPGGTGTIVTGLLVVSGWTVIRRRWWHRGWTVSVVLAGVSLASLVAGWHGATPELGRLAIVAAVGLRIALVVQIGFLIEGEIGARRRSAAPTSPLTA